MCITREGDPRFDADSPDLPLHLDDDFARWCDDRAAEALAYQIARSCKVPPPVPGAAAVSVPRPPRVPRIPRSTYASDRALPALRPAPLDVLVLDWHLARLVGDEGEVSP